MKIFAYLHPELDIRCCALLEESISANVEVIEFEVDNVDDVVYDGTQIRLKTNEEKLQEVKQKKLTELKSYTASLLLTTDYIVVKISKVQLLGDIVEVENLKQKYSIQLQEREAIRNWNEQMKQSINNAKTLEDINSIEIKFTT